MKLLNELKRRKVFRVAAVYAVVAWLLIQVADVVLPTFGTPAWVNQTLIFLFVIGFPLALILAWAYEVTPDGVRAESGSGPATSPPAANQGLLYATFALVLLVAGFQVADRFLASQPSPTSEAAPSSVSGSSASSEAPAMRVSVRLPDEQAFHFSRGDFDLSPDGSFFVYLGSGEDEEQLLWLRRWDSLQGQPLPGTENAARPRISPDGTEVLFPASGEIKVLTLSTGQTRTLYQASTNLLGIVPNWSEDGSSIYFVNDNFGISRMPATGGEQEELVELNRDNGDERFSFLAPLPDSGLLFTAERSNGVRTIRARHADGQVKELVDGQYPVYSASGHLLFQREEAARLLASPFDPENLELLGPPVEIDRGLLLVGGGNVGNVSVSDTGRLLYRKGDASGRLARPVWVSRDGSITEVQPNWQMFTGFGYGIAALSPDDSAITVAERTSVGYANIWVNQLDGPMTRITFGEQRVFLPTWSADGGTVYYTSNENERHTIRAMRADGSGLPRVVAEDRVPIRDSQVSRDGRWLVFRDLPSGEDSARIRALDLTENGEAITLLETDHQSTSPTLSPDGRWLAYVSDESGEFEVYVRPFPDVDSGRWQVSINGGTEPRWAHSGDELFYRNGANDMVAVTVVAGDAFQWQPERILFDASPFRRSGDGQVTTYSVTSDDQRFLMMRLDQVLDTELILVDNWLADMEW